MTLGTNGVISGTPTKDGESTTFGVTYAGTPFPMTAERSFTLRVDAVAPATTDDVPSAGGRAR